MISNGKVSFLKKELIEKVKELSTKKKDKLNVQVVLFDKEDIDRMGGAVKVGYYIHVKNEKTGIIQYIDWEKVPVMTLVKVKDKLNQNKFYGIKNIHGEDCKVRIKK